MSGKAASVGVLRVDVGSAGDVEGLDVEDREVLRPIKAAQHNVRSVREASARASHPHSKSQPSHPLLEGAASVRALGTWIGIDILRAEESAVGRASSLFKIFMLFKILVGIPTHSRTVG